MKPFIHITEDRKYLIISRCDWIYPQATEDTAGPRDEARYNKLGRSDGDIVLPFPEGAWKDVADAELILNDLFKSSKKEPR